MPLAGKLTCPLSCLSVRLRVLYLVSNQASGNKQRVESSACARGKISTLSRQLAASVTTLAAVLWSCQRALTRLPRYLHVTLRFRCLPGVECVCVCVLGSCVNVPQVLSKRASKCGARDSKAKVSLCVPKVLVGTHNNNSRLACLETGFRSATCVPSLFIMTACGFVRACAVKFNNCYASSLEIIFCAHSASYLSS